MTDCLPGLSLCSLAPTARWISLSDLCITNAVPGRDMTVASIEFLLVSEYAMIFLSGGFARCFFDAEQMELMSSSNDSRFSWDVFERKSTTAVCDLRSKRSHDSATMFEASLRCGERLSVHEGVSPALNSSAL